MNINEIFFELIQVALGVRVCLSHSPTAEEWKMLYDIAKKQSLVGICFAGVQKLGEGGVETSETLETSWNPPELLYLTWMGMAAKIQQRNQVVDEQTAQFYRKVSNDGYKACVLKGQAVAALYRLHANDDANDNCRTDGSMDSTSSPQVPHKPSTINLSGLRQSGDIDMWMVAEPDNVIEWARATGSMFYYDYHHADLSLYQDTEIELHYRPTLSRNLVRNHRLQKWFREEGEKHIIFNDNDDVDDNLGFATPDYTFNVVLTMNHNFWHLMYEGVGMRQMMDLYFVLRSLPTANANDRELSANLSVNTSSDTSAKNVNNIQDETLKLLKHLKLLRFTSASMWIMKEVFGLEDEYLLCEPDEDVGRFLLDEIMQAGNFGKHDQRLKEGRYKTSRIGLMWAWMKHNLRLIKYYPADVLWTPIGILRISLWRRWHYRNENELKNI